MDRDKITTKLKEEFSRFREMPFPKGVGGEDIEDLYIELADYDGYLAGLITSFLAGENISSKNINRENNFDDRFDELLEMVDALRNYKETLDNLFALFLEALQSEE